MANFSVEWLSRSYYDEVTHRGEEAAQYSEINGEVEEFTKESAPTSPNDSCYTSGSESEVGEDSEGEATQQRRMRTKFTSEQINKLEKTFGKDRYLGAAQRRKIAERLRLSETQVKTWFQNRRMKLKREVQDLRPEFLPVPASLLPPLLFQHHALSGQLPVYSGIYPQLQPLHRAIMPAALHQQRSPPVIMPPHFY
ncbi:ventral expressed homeobox [Notolabrus celidotus]|uniref:ventral expressed homeobox n=1 Tax=Notolabrus celidotus TaxID=1203425 RepID=UPI001490514F|nr:ventral expressed homeobox [Notolabrus celidotus]XP_034538259.1 ventral expressed homeobox [Notolabrus celidotus]